MPLMNEGKQKNKSYYMERLEDVGDTINSQKHGRFC